MKTFKDYISKKEEMTTTGPGIAGTSPGDTADWVYGTKKKRRPLSRSYIEINGKFKKQVR